MTQANRRDTLLAMINTKGAASLTELKDAIGVSEATARRYLKYLEDQRLITRVHGGAIARGAGEEWPFAVRETLHTDEKMQIAQAAMDHIKDGQTLALNGGTITTAIARLLAARPAAGDRNDQNIVVTTAVNVAHELAANPRISVMMTGGMVRHASLETIGPQVTEALSRISLDVAIIGVDGVDERSGITIANEFEAANLRMMTRQAKRTIIVADTTKLCRAAFSQVCSLSSVATLITNGVPPTALEQALTASGTRLIVTGT